MTKPIHCDDGCTMSPQEALAAMKIAHEDEPRISAEEFAEVLETLPAQIAGMKMSQAMQLCGYGALPGGADIIRKEQAREAGQKVLPPKTNYPDFTFSVSRDFSDDEVEVEIEVTHYRQGTVLKPGLYISPSDPAFDSGEVEFGDAVSVATGKTIELTRLELEAAEEAFWNQ